MTQYEPVESPDATTVFEYHDLSPPTTGDVYQAQSVVTQHLPRTPLVRSEPLSTKFDAEVLLKREDTLPTGAFKVRGGVTLTAQLSEEFHEPGLIAASTGNHGQSIAYAGRSQEIPVTVVAPTDANQTKVTAMERLGATVISHGTTFDDAREHAETLAAEYGYRYVHSANEPSLIAGVGTAGLEVVEDCPDVDFLVCPVGGGSSASGYCLTVGAMTDATVVGVQSEAAPAMYRAWSESHLDPHDRMETTAEGLATRVPFALTMGILQERLDEFRLVPEATIRREIGDILREDRIVAEGASAAPIAALREMRDHVRNSTIVVPISGRNVAPEVLREALEGVIDS